MLDDGTWVRRVKLRPTTGFDEEALGTAEARKSPARMIDILLSRTIVRLGELSDPNLIERYVPKLLVGDRVALLCMLYKISESDIVPYTLNCPTRNEAHRFTLDFNLDDLAYDVYDEPPPAFLEAELPNGYLDGKGILHKDIRIELMRGEHTHRLTQIEDLGALRSNILELATLQIGTFKRLPPVAQPVLENGAQPLDVSVIRGLRTKDRKFLDRLMSSYSPGPKYAYGTPCPSCGRNTMFVVNPDDFFGP